MNMMSGGAKLKELHWLEEKARANGALEKNKRTAEKARNKATTKKIAFVPEGEKKQRKKAAAAKSPLVTTKELEIKDSPLTITKRPQNSFQFTKSKTNLSPPLHNRRRRRIKQHILVLLMAVFVLALFLLGNIGFYSNLRRNTEIQSRRYGF